MIVKLVKNVSVEKMHNYASIVNKDNISHELTDVTANKKRERKRRLIIYNIVKLMELNAYNDTLYTVDDIEEKLKEIEKHEIFTKLKETKMLFDIDTRNHNKVDNMKTKLAYINRLFMNYCIEITIAQVRTAKTKKVNFYALKRKHNIDELLDAKNWYNHQYDKPDDYKKNEIQIYDALFDDTDLRESTKNAHFEAESSDESDTDDSDTDTDTDDSDFYDSDTDDSDFYDSDTDDSDTDDSDTDTDDSDTDTDNDDSDDEMDNALATKEEKERIDKFMNFNEGEYVESDNLDDLFAFLDATCDNDESGSESEEEECTESDEEEFSDSDDEMDDIINDMINKKEIKKYMEMEGQETYTSDNLDDLFADLNEGSDSNYESDNSCEHDGEFSIDFNER